MRSPLAPLLALLCLPGLAACAGEQAETIVLATTTSVQDTGLLETLLPRFREESGIGVQTVAVGTGAALRMGREGNADVLLTHAPSAERELLESGALASRTEIMQNYFVIAGPAEDPADVRSAPSAAEAFRRIRASEVPYVSRGDDSGTHKKEVELWRAAGLDPEDRWPGAASTGAGMGASLQVAGERQAYVLSDLGTFLAYQPRIGLVALSQPAAALRNVYSVMRVSPERFEGRVHAESARALEAFFTRPDVQDEIGRFGTRRYGRPLFEPLRPARDG